MFAQIGERDNFVTLPRDFIWRQTQQRRRKLDIRKTRVLRMKSRPKLQQRADTAIDGRGSPGGPDYAADYLEQRRFAGTVLTDDSERFAAAQVE